MLNPDRLAAFQDAYVLEIYVAVQHMKPHLGAQNEEEYALSATANFIAKIISHGCDAVARYGLNDGGGAFARTADALGVSVSGLQGYLEGK